ncbi:tyrosine-type recombinase/integrase [Raineyella sp.]|uniref:Tyrosine recombinase XerC n=1 Tax=bioreactor metagenome TaxID=1076179 RepID=A0A644Y4T7_9ZZZZ|nr:tyrosine-type recombinase/integrase [Raineyella sp.]MEA5155574.1 tyrosine-type recombinase/integrase [Raineyella sp.]
MSDVWRRCGCRDENGRQYRPLPKNPTDDQQARACPTMLTDPKHGTWGYTVSAGSDPATGKRRQIRKAGFTGVRAAERARAKLVTSLDDGTYREASNITVGEYCTAWLPRRKATGNGLRPSTARMYDAYITKDIVPSKLGATRLQDLRRSHVADFVHGLVEAGRGAPTVKRIIATLQAALAQAVKDEVIIANPATDTDLPTVRRKPVQAWEPAQVRAFLDQAATHRLGPLYEVTVLTGMRRGEVCGLRWDDVDLEHRRLTIRHNRVDAGGKVVESEPKTAAGRRSVALSDDAVAALLAWRLQQQTEAAEWAEAWNDTGYVFTLEDGNPLHPTYVTRLFQTIRKAAKLPDGATFHHLRHQAASNLIAAGVDIAVVSKILGHESIAITSDFYGHLVGSVAQDAVNAAAELLRTPAEHTLNTQGGAAA